MRPNQFKSTWKCWASLLVLWLLAACQPLRADDRVDLEAQLRAEYYRKILILRVPCAGNKLEFDESGSLQDKLEPDSWTTSAEIEVTDLHLQSDLLDVSANRIFLAYLDGQFKSLFPLSSGAFPVQEIKLGKGERKWWDKKREVHITIQLRRGATEGSVHDAMNRVFLRPDEHVSDVVPPFWKSFFGVTNADIAQKTTDGVLSQAATSAVPVTQGPSSGASAPHVQYQPDPEYSELARQARYHGTVVLRMIIDAAGKPTDIRIVKPLGLGLDEKGVQAVSKWKFAPAKKEGEPVAVQINVEIAFRLY